MSAEQNKALVRRVFEESINKHNLNVFDELLASNYVNHNMPTPAPGPEGLKQVVSMFLTAFPDFQVTVEDMIAEGNKVATRGYGAAPTRVISWASRQLASRWQFRTAISGILRTAGL